MSTCRETSIWYVQIACPDRSDEAKVLLLYVYACNLHGRRSHGYKFSDLLGYVNYSGDSIVNG
jgi:hypothetical protein